ncbi:hypothetical protein [Sphingomonas melonis]|jgi:hypothetical protein|uniref:hypothetical protein n=1 Tax=Sphingomonas melonis TaxID=152682 RepID=UPI0003665D3D|nr:hypothetical protein [Sphingomonas melonis]
MEAAWTTAALGRSKQNKFPTLKDLLSTRSATARPKPAASWQSMYAAAAGWAAAMGEIRTEGDAG